MFDLKMIYIIVIHALAFTSTMKATLEFNWRYNEDILRTVTKKEDCKDSIKSSKEIIDKMIQIANSLKSDENYLEINAFNRDNDIKRFFELYVQLGLGNNQSFYDICKKVGEDSYKSEELRYRIDDNYENRMDDKLKQFEYSFEKISNDAFLMFQNLKKNGYPDKLINKIKRCRKKFEDGDAHYELPEYKAWELNGKLTVNNWLKRCISDEIFQLDVLSNLLKKGILEFEDKLSVYMRYLESYVVPINHIDLKGSDIRTLSLGSDQIDCKIEGNAHEEIKNIKTFKFEVQFVDKNGKAIDSAKKTKKKQFSKSSPDKIFTETLKFEMENYAFSDATQLKVHFCSVSVKVKKDYKVWTRKAVTAKLKLMLFEGEVTRTFFDHLLI